MSKYPILSIRQPWTGVCVLGLKPVENRTRRIPEKYIGQTVLLHAGLQVDSNVVVKGYSVEANAYRLVKRVMYHQGKVLFENRIAGHEHVFNTGGIVGCCKFVKCVNDSESPWAERGAGIWHWCMVEARPLPFFPCKGMLGFFQVDYPYAVEVCDA
ncbi:hypothetical protein [Maridesulfovibrio ferrireducens]|uniref:hypothetical protein n=1 Tax=Maridesulfovibrio ferrireducens TaxID=246191 RepID=UPI001A353C5F|nr:hypothetical protein [Maridesulfovibrio ferrireducens]MBI9110023.1 hypothetical protein [Maridesulfovibrio ferrireducens]